MRPGVRKLLAVLVVLLTAFGWMAVVHGIPTYSHPLAREIPRGLDIEGGVYVVLEAQDVKGMSDEELREAMDRTQTVIKNRVDAMGLMNPNVSVEGGNRIRVELPGMENAEAAVELVGKTAQLKFTLADGSPILDGNSVKNAAITTNTSRGNYGVELEFDSAGASAFEEATKTTSAGGVTSTMTTSSGVAVPDNSIVISLDDEIISYPTADRVISGNTCVIEGDFTQEEAGKLAALIRGGALPIELKELSSSSQTATIGLGAFENSVKAGLIGLVLILLLMLFCYRIMGLAADLALLLYVVIMLAAMALMGSVLTLPGIAGIILSIGMAVDANVIIFSRIKEEIVSGKSVRVAVKSGYKRAVSTVMDAQITTLIATVILYQLGTSSVKGFAWTLMIGIVASIFTAVVITQLFLNVFAETKAFAKNSYFCVKEDGTPTLMFSKRFSFMKHRKKYFIASAAIIVIGLVVGLAGGFNRGIDFTGGTMIHMDMGKQVSAEQIKEVADGQGINTRQMEIVFSGPGNEEAIIRTNENLNSDERNAFIDALQKEFGTYDSDILASEHFGPSVGRELTQNALMSLGLAAIGMLIYIRFRFRQWRFGAAAIAGVLHDVFILLAFYGIFRVTINNPFIAAILTVVGYSINDTIVIFDRVRENYRLTKTSNTEALLDDSINQTLTRSVMTSLTTLLVMVPMMIMAGSTVREFVLPLMVGVLAGTYSSIFLCSPLYYVMSNRKKKVTVGGRVKKNTYQGAPPSEKKDKAAREAAKQEALANMSETEKAEAALIAEAKVEKELYQEALSDAERPVRKAGKTPQGRSKTKRKKKTHKK